jgi:NADPH:quinone reductase-like Zn-dependent oxidoreductase
MQTAIGALFAPSTLNMTRPSIPPNPSPNGKKILIWGGASAMGAVSISHASAAGYTVITTSSPHNFEFVKSLGASHVFDYHTEEKTIEDIKHLFPIDHFYDCVSLRSSITAMAQIASASIEAGDANEVVIQTLTPLSMVGNPTLPDGVTAKMVLFRNGAEENKDVVEWMLKKGGYLERGLKEGWFRGVRGEVIGGLNSANDGLKRRKMENLSGVSASRLIVEPWKE